MDFYERAKEKLEGGAVSTDRKASLMAPAVKEALLSFCGQNEEFAQAVAQGGSFKDCMDAVAKGAGTSISDLDAYKKAVAFYFKGADVQMTLTIRLAGDSEQPTVKKPIVLDLEDFL